MQFRRLNATFGKLTNRTLTLAPGLNIVEAPNESGKSTLAAFLRTMLYGLKTNERGTLADKNRYAPWSGSAMSGTLELSTELGDITLQRDTARVNAPMGHFSAVYTGTSEGVAQLTAADCGEQLLGIPREVYERSAFIRQSGLAIDADAELERRIAALITTGEEGASYSETVDVLKSSSTAAATIKLERSPRWSRKSPQTRSTLRNCTILSYSVRPPRRSLPRAKRSKAPSEVILPCTTPPTARRSLRRCARRNAPPRPSMPKRRLPTA